MKYGLTLFPTDYSIHPGELAAAAEAKGFESLWVPEHSHFPVSPMTPGHDEGGLPNMYYDVVDPFVALSMAAQATEKLLLGTSICLVVQRDPIQLAKQVASLDALSGGRFQLGVGGGWNPLEIANHGTDFAERLAVMAERIDAMKQIWTEEKAEYHGKYVDFAPLYAWPKPAQKPHPPIHVAANAPKGFGRVVSQGDGWFPILDSETAEAAVFSHLADLHRRLEKAGRDPDGFEVSGYMCPADEALVVRAREAGLTRVIFLLQPEPAAKVLPEIDRLAELVARCEA
jgi:probable F420-dependent oxidoreductase